MSCRRISRWVLRNGAEGIPPEWRDHIDSCPTCLASVARIRTLDGLLGEMSDPDPGEAYESGFVTRLARRLDATTAVQGSSVQVRRPLAWLWAPALAAAALAFFIGREVYLQRQVQPVTEKDIPVITNNGEKATVPSTAAAPARIEEKVGQQRSAGQAAKPASPDAPTHRDVGENAASVREPAAQPTVPDGQPSGNRLLGSDATAKEAQENAPAVTVQPGATGIQTPTAADSKVWPDRRVTIMGAIAADTQKNARRDERGLPGQGPHGLSERGYVDGAPGAETAHAYHPMERLEAPQWRATPGFPDSQSPAEAMRRLDQLAELRQQIATLLAIEPSARTAAQNRELCALWYRVGTLATERPLLDSALQQLGACLKATDQSESADWISKTSQLTGRLSAMPK